MSQKHHISQSVRTELMERVVVEERKLVKRRTMLGKFLSRRKYDLTQMSSNWTTFSF